MNTISRSKSETFTKTNNSKMANNTKRNPMAESIILSMTDLERIKKNATILSKEEEMSNNKIIEDQKVNLQANAMVKLLFILKISSTNFIYL
jgi:hypothetical protein